MPYRRLLSIAAGRLARRRAERAGAAQLAVVVEILAAHVRAGRSLRQALADAAADLPEPAAGRVAAAAADAALGTPAADALAALGEGSDVAYLAAAVRLHTRSGGDLALLLERTAELLHERAAQRRAAEVATAQARATGRIVTGMPALGVAALYVADRSGFDLLRALAAGVARAARLGRAGGARPRADRAHLGGRPVIALLLLVGAGMAFSAARSAAARDRSLNPRRPVAGPSPSVRLLCAIGRRPAAHAGGPVRVGRTGMVARGARRRARGRRPGGAARRGG